MREMIAASIPLGVTAKSYVNGERCMGVRGNAASVKVQ